MAITVVAGTTHPSSRVALGNGRQALLTATSDSGQLPAGEWSKNGTAVPGQSGPSLLVTMSASGDAAGVYTYKPSDQDADSNAVSEVTITKKSFWSDILHLPALLALAGIIVVFVLGIGVLLSGWWIHASKYKHPAAITVRAYCFAILTLLIFLVLVELSGRVSQNHGSGLLGLFAGSDQRASTSKFQYLLWTFLIGFALAYVAARTSITDTPFTCDKTSKNCISGDNWTSYLLLLGLPAGVAVVAKGIMSYKVQNQTVQKTDNTGGFALTDLATNDAGAPDLVDIQYLLFNLIALAYVLTAFIAKGTLPDIPDLLLGLTSAAAGTYVLNKSLQTNAPILSSVVPSLIYPGQQVRVTGRNLFPVGTSSAQVDVVVGGVRTPGTRVPSASVDTLTFIAPSGMSATDPTVHVVTAAQVQTDGFPVSFGTITVYGWASSIPSAEAGPVSLLVGGLPDDLAGTSIVVRIDGLTTNVDQIVNSTLQANKPATTATTVDVSVFSGDQSATATLPVLAP
jgi:hypothetical protein